MRSLMVSLVALVAVAGCGGASTGDSCTQAVCPFGGGAYQFCSSAGAKSCRYVAGDNTIYSCTTCGDCSAAEAAISSWCSKGNTTTASTETCTTATCPQGSSSYKLCTTTGAASCRYLASDGTAFDCASCNDCATAASNLSDWCAGDSTTGTTSSGGTTGTVDTTTCDDCLNTAEGSGGACQSQADACSNDADCVTLINCLNACASGDQTCVDNCFNAAPPATQTTYGDLGSCLCDSACASQCASECTQ